MDCGLYRTGRALAGAEDLITAGALVHLHDHRPDEWPMAHLPKEHRAGRWEFDESGWQVLDAAFLLALVPLPPEGWYSLRLPVATGDEDGQALAARSLVLVGYNRQGHCILFPAQFGEREVRFAERGLRFEDLDVLDALEPVNFDVPADQAARVLH